MGAYDNGFGVTLIATWLATLLAGVGLTHAVHYFVKFSNDPLYKRALVGVVLFLLFFGLAFECAKTYLNVVTYWGNPIVFEAVPFPISTESFAIPCVSLIEFMVDQFLISRFYALRVDRLTARLLVANLDTPRSKIIWITVILTMLNLLSLAMSFVIVQILATHVGQPLTLAELHRLGYLSDVWDGTSAVKDVAIAASLIWTLRGMKTSFKGTTQFIQHIMVVSIQNGCITSAVSISGIIAKNLAPATGISFVFYFTIVPLNLLTLLSNLTLRASAPVPVSHDWSSNANPAFRNGQGGVHFQCPAATAGGAFMTTDTEASRGEYAESTVRGASDDIEAGEKEPGAYQYPKTEKLQARLE
ncbi:hypothetical protein C8R46DRAFT_1346888 [Mycena filopes]|nr:hypothetical protein C8R46DRAFT_1346888 [Mycena filopes]